MKSSKRLHFNTDVHSVMQINSQNRSVCILTSPSFAMRINKQNKIFKFVSQTFCALTISLALTNENFKLNHRLKLKKENTEKHLNFDGNG